MAVGVGAGALGLRRVAVVDQRRAGHRPHTGVLDRACRASARQYMSQKLVVPVRIISTHASRAPQ
jgi:hypothetical protein